LDTLYSNLTHSDKPFAATGIGAGRALNAIAICAISLGMPIEEMIQKTSVMTNININSPHKLDDSMAYGAMQMVLLDQAVSVRNDTCNDGLSTGTTGRSDNRSWPWWSFFWV
ncbi:MAG: trimethylamine:corrinoid methyltransferase-like protein, partial [Granulosicoccus sp.]